MTQPLLILFLATSSVVACGPWFPNYLLDGGDDELLAAPQAQFVEEMQRLISSITPVFHARPSTNNHTAQTLEIDLADLKEALAGVPAEPAASTLRQYRQVRLDLAAYLRSMESWKSALAPPLSWTGTPVPATTNPPPAFPALKLPAQLPPEFADYLRGATAYHQEQFDQAQAAWKQLLARPASQRHFRSTWAAYMLGRLLFDQSPSQALPWFQQVRILAQQGFSDNLGLAAVSLGWEARIRLRQQQFEKAIDLYLQEAATGSTTAINSLDTAASLALCAGPKTLLRLAKQPTARRVITAYVISRRAEDSVDIDGPIKEAALRLLSALPMVNLPTRNWHRYASLPCLWLEAAEKARVTDLEQAEQVALAAYQQADIPQARRWIQRAPSTPLIQWLQVKLLLYDGKLDQAAILLANTVKHFPTSQTTNSLHTQSNLASRLLLFGGDDPLSPTTASDQALGELGVLHLARSRYVEALDSLLRAGFSMDAGYVAERVLTLDELKTYVDRSWAAPLSPSSHQLTPPDSLSQNLSNQCRDIRYLLARRLARTDLTAPALPYYPPEWQPVHQRFRTQLDTGHNAVLPNATRAEALFNAATLARTNGMALFGTEVEPDWACYYGEYEGSDHIATRSLTLTNVAKANPDELRRARQHHPTPDTRYHYRYTAAELAWEAAQLMPDNSDQTALVLWTAGTWLKNRDPDTADRFYKALVRRCRKTPLGEAADRKRWFPALDPQGRPVEVRSPE